MVVGDKDRGAGYGLEIPCILSQWTQALRREDEGAGGFILTGLIARLDTT